MAEQRTVPDLPALNATPANGDLLHIVDVSDTTEASTGTSKRITRQNLVGGLADDADLTALQSDFDAEHNSDGTHKETSLDSMIAGVEAAGDIIYHNGTIWTRLPKGLDGQLLRLASGLPAWVTTDGWTPYSTVTPTSGTLDSPSFEIVFAGVDLSAVLYPGMRVKITQGTVKYFIITKVAFSTNTTVTLYGGTDYSLVATGTTAISAFSYSQSKAPAGFPLDPAKWTVEVTDTTSRNQASPVQNTWYNVGTISINVPIGAWHISWQGNIGADKGSNATIAAYATLSTANNSQSDADLTAGVNSASVLQLIGCVGKTKFLTVTAKTPYYYNTMTNVASLDHIYNDNASAKLIIRAVCAYL